MSEPGNLPSPRYRTLRWDNNAYLAACFEALKLRTRGLGYRQIAAEQGVTVPTAHKRVTDAIKANGAKDAETERALDVERLDAYLMVIHERMRQGDPKAMEVALRVMDRRAKLLGLDTPVKVDAKVTVQDDREAELQEVLNEAKAKWAAMETEFSDQD